MGLAMQARQHLFSILSGLYGISLAAQRCFQVIPYFRFIVTY
jgi:hypothetical protein